MNWDDITPDEDLQHLLHDVVLQKPDSVKRLQRWLDWEVEACGHVLSSAGADGPAERCSEPVAPGSEDCGGH